MPVRSRARGPARGPPCGGRGEGPRAVGGAGLDLGVGRDGRRSGDATGWVAVRCRAWHPARGGWMTPPRWVAVWGRSPTCGGRERARGRMPVPGPMRAGRGIPPGWVTVRCRAWHAARGGWMPPGSMVAWVRDWVPVWCGRGSARAVGGAGLGPGAGRDTRRSVDAAGMGDGAVPGMAPGSRLDDGAWVMVVWAGVWVPMWRGRGRGLGWGPVWGRVRGLLRVRWGGASGRVAV